MTFLEKENPLYSSKVVECRGLIEQWLAYIPQTFPHYTRHTVRHSDEIILQLSKLLFRDEGELPAINLSPTEAYILVMASYLHDAGMVCSDHEKMAILQSEAWERWVTDGTGSQRWRNIEALRHAHTPEPDALRNFLADVQTRFLLAEFVRRQHHRRSAHIVQAHEDTLGRFGFGERSLTGAIRHVCLAHGLRHQELNDPERYPERVDVRGDRVNLRFLAFLLRIGDLLDMSEDRACALLLNAACPLPPESYAHWSQYACITHRLTAPDVIEISAECAEQEEHRYLQDWCKWLVDEVHAAGVSMANARRHGDWRAPRVELEGPLPTVKIQPAQGATYMPSRWVLQLDPEAICERLIRHTYTDKNAFVRELIQNALDATRCKMCLDMQEEGENTPEFPTQAPEARRAGYPVRVILTEEKVEQAISGECQTCQVLVVEDKGIGMDRDIIERFFLQVGRSFYQTEAFRRNFKFVASSRFGIGFLSVFNRSDHVTLETYKPSSAAGDGPLRLTLTGPRNYLLTERGSRTSAGTQVKVRLREPFEQGELTRLLRAWCLRVEFPVVVEEFGERQTVTAWRPDRWERETPDVRDDTARFVVRSFPIQRRGLEGELYVLAHRGKRGESWTAGGRAQSYVRGHPAAELPPMPPPTVCICGIATAAHSEVPMHTATSVVCDVRKESEFMTVSRESAGGPWGLSRFPFIEELASRWHEVLSEHLESSEYAKGPDAWRYKQRVAELFAERTGEQYWGDIQGMLPVYVDKQRQLMSRNELAAIPRLMLVGTTAYSYTAERLTDDVDRESVLESLNSPVVFWTDVERLVRQPGTFFLPHGLIRACLCGKWEVAMEARACAGQPTKGGGEPRYPYFRGTFAATPLQPGHKIAAVVCSRSNNHLNQILLLNRGHALVGWVQRCLDASRTEVPSLQPKLEKVLELIRRACSRALRKDAIAELEDYLRNWAGIEGLQEDLCPPSAGLSDGAFCP